MGILQYIESNYEIVQRLEDNKSILTIKREGKPDAVIIKERGVSFMRIH